MNPCKESIEREFQFFNNYISLWGDTYYHFNILGGMPQLYVIDFM